MADETVRVALVGHCGFDSWGLKRAVKKALGKGASVSQVNNESELENGAFDLLLINRKLDGRFKAKDGIDVIRSRVQSDGGAPMMLISNFEDAQARAREAGAVPGFGKNDLGSGEALERLRSALAERA